MKHIIRNKIIINKKYHTIGTVAKSNRKIVERDTIYTYRYVYVAELFNKNILTYKRVKLHIQINTLSPLGVEWISQ